MPSLAVILNICVNNFNVKTSKIVNMFCFSSDWSTCQLSPNAVCGGGIKTRMLDCVRSDGKSVDIKFCEEVRLENPSGVCFWTFPFCFLEESNFTFFV